MLPTNTTPLSLTYGPGCHSPLKESHGQLNTPPGSFIARGAGYTMFLTAGGAVLDLRGPCVSAGSAVTATVPLTATTDRSAALATAPAAGATEPAQAAAIGAAQPNATAAGVPPTLPTAFGDPRHAQPCARGGAVLRFHPTNGANAAPRLVGQDQQPGIVNYLIGNNPAQWHTNVHTYAKVAYQDVYPGVSMVYYGNQGRLEEDYLVAPGTDPSSIHIAVDGAQGLSTDAQGNLVLQTAVGALTESKPLIYQKIDGKRQEVSGRYTLDGSGEARFQVGTYDATKPLNY